MSENKLLELSFEFAVAILGWFCVPLIRFFKKTASITAGTNL